jgi:FAD/FMN-containing dehydrogenase
MKQSRYQPWGRYPKVPQTARVLAGVDAGLGLAAGERVLAFGNGRSYGDSCLTAGTLLDTARMNRVISFDVNSGIVRCEAGVLLCDLTSRVLPAGWFVAVTPGTQFVTIGGAIANDIHGKNHHIRGTFGCHVQAFELLRSDGSRRICSASENSELFAATIGGLGLTGLITWADIQLMPVASSQIDQTVTPFDSLAEFVQRARAADTSHEYSVAWIDSLASGRDLGRGLFIKGNHAAAGNGAIIAAAGQARLSVPFDPPLPLIGKATLKVFNALYRRQTMGREKSARVGYQPFFYPLDRIGAWNRLYGPRGLLQHQSVVPLDRGIEVVADLLARSRGANLGSFLTVLKVFGNRPSPGLMSFPKPGLTLTLDFANNGPAVFSLLEELDRVVVAAGGRINPYKDARMSATTFAASFPQFTALTPHIDPAFQSLFWSRVTGSP